MPASSSAPHSNKDQAPAREQVLQQLERILAHPLFHKSERLSNFLRYSVETTLAGEADRLKEFVIGTEVFKRGDSFDPQTDNIVRVNANRLRSKLAEYYHLSGQMDPVVIDLPKGRYVPFFTSLRGHAQDPSTAFKRAAAIKTSVGRQHELDRIRAAFASASCGPGRMVAISGDAGMGKTTIVGKDFLCEIQTIRTAVWIARGQCSERLVKTDEAAGHAGSSGGARDPRGPPARLRQSRAAGAQARARHRDRGDDDGARRPPRRVERPTQPDRCLTAPDAAQLGDLVGGEAPVGERRVGVLARATARDPGSRPRCREKRGAGAGCSMPSCSTIDARAPRCAGAARPRSSAAPARSTRRCPRAARTTRRASWCGRAR